MSNTTKTKQEALLHSQTNAKEMPRENSPLIIHKEIPDTPFHITGSDEHGYFVRLGDYRLTKIHKTIHEAEMEIHNEPWNITLRMIGAVTERIITDRELVNKKP